MTARSADLEQVAAEVRRGLAELACPADGAAMQAYMKSEMPCLGVRSAEVQRVVREVTRQRPLPDAHTWEAVVRMLWDEASHREERYAAIWVAREPRHRRFRTPQSLDLYRHLVATGRWWDYVDQVASHLVGEQLREHPSDVTPVVDAWATDDDLWLRRTAILAQLMSRQDTDLALLEHTLTSNLLDSPHGSDFFIRKAVGWALRQHARVDPDWVLTFTTTYAGLLAPLSRREALKHL